MNCFVCGAAGTHIHTYDRSVGFFAIGGEPRTCAGCADYLRALSDSERQTVYINGGFETTQEPPSGADGPLGDIVRRDRELRNRGQS